MWPSVEFEILRQPALQGAEDRHPAGHHTCQARGRKGPHKGQQCRCHALCLSPSTGEMSRCSSGCVHPGCSLERYGSCWAGKLESSVLSIRVPKRRCGSRWAFRPVPHTTIEAHSSTLCCPIDSPPIEVCCSTSRRLDAPATVLSTARDQIRNRAYKPLPEVISNLPGFDAIVANSATYKLGYRTPRTQRRPLMTDERGQPCMSAWPASKWGGVWQQLFQGAAGHEFHDDANGTLVDLFVVGDRDCVGMLQARAGAAPLGNVRESLTDPLSVSSDVWRVCSFLASSLRWSQAHESGIWTDLWQEAVCAGWGCVCV